MEITAQDWATIPYHIMVQKLFKVGKELGNQYGNAMHAAVGIAGEVKELLCAENRDNFVEECGDLEFYLCALQQSVPDLAWDSVDLATLRPSTFQALQVDLQNASGDLLDIIKKGWVYNRPIDDSDLLDVYEKIRAALTNLYDFINVDTPTIQLCNKEKLIGPNGRYKGMAYSDEAAQARADKY